MQINLPKYIISFTTIIGVVDYLNKATQNIQYQINIEQLLRLTLCRKTK